MINSETLPQMLDPEFEGLERETALETFVDFEADIHRIARREFVKRLGAGPPLLAVRR